MNSELKRCEIYQFRNGLFTINKQESRILKMLFSCSIPTLNHSIRNHHSNAFVHNAYWINESLKSFQTSSARNLNYVRWLYFQKLLNFC